jgi:hypothetical protein
MTAAERLIALAGQTGTAAALLLLIGTGATAGEALVDYSELATGTAEQHLLVDKSIITPPTVFAGGMAPATVQRDPFQHIRQDDNEVVLIIAAMLGELL